MGDDKHVITKLFKIQVKQKSSQIHLFNATLGLQLHLLSNRPNFFCKSAKNYKFINVKTPRRKVIKHIIIQSYYTLSNKNNEAELMFLFSIGLSRLINRLSLISNRNLLWWNWQVLENKVGIAHRHFPINFLKS